MSSDPNYEWEQLLAIDDSDHPLTPVLRPCNSHVHETTTTTTTQVEETLVIIFGPAGIVQAAKLLKQRNIVLGWDGEISGTIAGAIHHKVINEGGYGKDITVGSSLILVNILVFSPKPSMHYPNIIIKNVVKVFYKDSVLGYGSGVGGSVMLMEEEEIVKLMEEEEMVDLELHVCWNVTHQEMADEEALNLALEEEARQAWADQRV
ncbi:GPCR kinase [Tanacetum coccineum]